MRKIINLIPLSSSGLVLSLGLLAILYDEYYLFSKILMAITFLFFILLTIKIVILNDAILERINDSIYGAVLGTYPMIFSVISIFIPAKFLLVGLIFWWTGLILQILYMVWYTIKFLTPIKIGEFMPSIYIIFVGITISSITSSKYHLEMIGKLIFLISSSLTILITPLIFRNVVIKKRLTEKTRPTGAIMAMPFSLCTLAYMNSFMIPTDNIIIVFIIASFFLVGIAITSIIRSISFEYNEYMPSYIFPMVISSLALKKASLVLLGSKNLFAFIAVRMFGATKILTIILGVFVFVCFINSVIKQYKIEKELI